MDIDIFERRKEMVQQMLDAHILYGEKFEKRFKRFMENNFPLEVTLSTSENNGFCGLRIAQKPIMEEKTA